MTTYEMLTLADENGKTYINDGIRYNKVKGFHDKNGTVSMIEYENNFDFLNVFVHDPDWEELKVKRIMLKEASEILENILNCPVEIVRL